MTCRSAYSGLQYAYAISTGRSGARTSRTRQVCRTSAERWRAVRVARAALRTDPISRGHGDAGCAVRRGVGGRLCKRGWAYAKRVDARATQPAPLRSLRHSLALATPPAELVKAEKGTFRKRESEIYIFTFVMKFDDLV